MNDYRKTALVVLRVLACYMVFDGLRELAAIVIYVPANFFHVIPAFYLNVEYFVYWGCTYLVGGLFLFSISRPLANRIVERVESEDDKDQP